ncbi:hypothetical protein AB0M12_27790 [Nocardia vinacea]
MLVDGPDERGGILIQGAAGIGKSALVDATVAAAAVAGVRVLRTAGVDRPQQFVAVGAEFASPVRPAAGAGIVHQHIQS